MTEIMLSLIRSTLSGEEYNIPKECDIDALLSLSKRHDLAHIVAHALEKRALLPKNELGEALKKQKLLAVFRRNTLDITEGQVCALFDEAKIDYIPLKGAVLKHFYPEEWMRTSCDIDILIKPDEREHAISLLTDKLGFKQESNGERDCSLISKKGANLELHFSILSDDEKRDSVLSRVWNYAIPSGCGTSRYFLKHEFFVFYHISHMQTHFLEGGCGVRPFIDLWLYGKSTNYSEDKVKSLLKESESLAFYKGIKELCDVWFNRAEHTELTRLLEEYTVSGGVYGTRENLGATGKHKKGNFFKYVFSRIFMPREKLRLVYPKIDKYPILIPFYQIKRWLRLFDKSTYNSAKSEIVGNKNAKNTDYLMKELGL